MSCASEKVNFRLLDPNVGWEDADPVHSNLVEDTSGVYLTLTTPGATDPSQILAYLPPRRLAQGCAACEWFLVTPYACGSRVLWRDACHPKWTELWGSYHIPAPLKEAVAVAVWRHLFAVSDRGTNRVFIWANRGEKLVTEIAFHGARTIAFTPKGELLVTSTQSHHISRFGRDGRFRGNLKASLPGQPNCMAVDSKCRVWVVIQHKSGKLNLWRAGWENAAFHQVTPDELTGVFRPTGLVAASRAGFCMQETDASGMSVTACFSWCGRAIPSDTIAMPAPPSRKKRGQLLTTALDSGIPRCRWHRVRLDADIPSGTSLAIAVATTEDPTAPAQGDPARDPDWSAFAAGPPHFRDWIEAPSGSTDFLINQPPGRFLYLRIRFLGNGTATPLVRRVRIDFPRVTSLQHIPAVYRKDPKAGDFTERFLALFDASVADVDRIIERYPALLDIMRVPEQVLPWLGTFFDIGFDNTWDADKRRAVLQAAPQLYRLRGTLAGLQLAAKLAFGVAPAIEELASTGVWGQLGDRKVLQKAKCDSAGLEPMLHRTARVSQVRLFGRARARFRLNASPLGSVPLRSYGNPDQDPFTGGAYRFRVLMPPMADNSPQREARLMNLIEAQKPAHTIASLRVGGNGFLLGKWSVIGVDTAFLPPAAPVLGSGGNIRLNRMSIVWNGPRGREAAAVVGKDCVVGIHTIAG